MFRIFYYALSLQFCPEDYDNIYMYYYVSILKYVFSLLIVSHNCLVKIIDNREPNPLDLTKIIPYILIVVRRL